MEREKKGERKRWEKKKRARTPTHHEQERERLERWSQEKKMRRRKKKKKRKEAELETQCKHEPDTTKKTKKKKEKNPNKQNQSTLPLIREPESTRTEKRIKKKVLGQQRINQMPVPSMEQALTTQEPITHHEITRKKRGSPWLPAAKANLNRRSGRKKKKKKMMMKKKAGDVSDGLCSSASLCISPQRLLLYTTRAHEEEKLVYIFIELRDCISRGEEGGGRRASASECAAHWAAAAMAITGMDFSLSSNYEIIRTVVYFGSRPNLSKGGHTHRESEEKKFNI